MSLPYVFATAAAGNVPASELDANFNTVAGIGICQCTATGTNTVALTPITNMPTIAAYTNQQCFSFTPAANSSGSVTVNISSVGALALYYQDGTTQVGSGGLSTAVNLVIAYLSALNAGAGGFQIVSSQNLPLVAGSNITLTNGAGGTTIAAVIPATSPYGFVNRLRNNSLTSWFHGTSGSITTAGGWTAEGVYCKPTGATVTFSQQSNLSESYYRLRITGASSNTDVKLRFVVSGLDVSPLYGNTQTFQFYILNNTGSSLTPTVTVVSPTALDNYSSTNTVLSAQNMQTVGSGSNTTMAYTWADTNGYEGYGVSVDIDFGALGSGAYFDIFGFDLRATPGVSTGINNSPPTPEIRDAQSDIAWNQRYFWSSYPNGTAGGTSMTATSYGLVGGFATNATGGMNFTFPVPLRAAPTVAVWDRAGNSNKFSFYVNGWTDNNGTVTVLAAGPTNAILYGSSQSNILWAMTADATITGA